MNNKYWLSFFAIYAIFSINALAQPGAIWAVSSSLDKNIEEYLPGTSIFILGEGFKSNDGNPSSEVTDFLWEITSETDSHNTRLAEGSGKVGLDGSFLVKTGWNIPSDSQAGAGSAHFRARIFFPECSTCALQEYDFRKVDTFYAIPEFPTIAMPIAAIIGLVFLFQHRRKKEE